MRPTFDKMLCDMSDANPIDAEVLEILRCPLTRSGLTQQGDELIAQVGGLRYPIRDGIPVLLIDEAKLPQGVSTLDEFKQKFADQIPK